MDGGKEKLDQLERERRNAHAAGEQDGDGGQDADFDARLRALHDLSQGGGSPARRLDFRR